MQKDRKVNGSIGLWAFGSFNPQLKRAVHWLQNLISLIALAIGCHYSAVEIPKQHGKNSVWGSTCCISADYL